MPTQLTKNDAIYFMCARDFIYAGEQYSMGDKFDQEIGMGRMDMLVRTRRVIPVVDDSDDMPRHWRHHVWLRKDISKKLGLIHREDSEQLVGESLHNRQKQGPDLITSVPTTPAGPSDSDIIKAQAHAAALTQKVLDAENADDLDDGCVGEHDPASNPDCEMAAQEQSQHRGADEGDALTEDEQEFQTEDESEEEPEDEVEEEDLYDPSEHSLPSVQEYLADASEEERQRVIAVERTGKNRKGITGG
jgi:hypothetical protein